EFEQQLADFGMLIFKFWLHISPDEQLRRFQQREETPYKAWKLTPEDWRNREKWKAYERAVDDMVLKTSTPYAPWTIVEANDKYYARIKVLNTVVDKLSQALPHEPLRPAGRPARRQRRTNPRGLPHPGHAVPSRPAGPS